MLRVRRLQSALRGPYELEIAAGSVVGLSGESGSGKSLLLRMIADLEPNHGDVTLEGRNRDTLSAPEWRRLVTYVAAEPSFWFESVLEHFTASRAALEARFADLGLDTSLVDAPVARLSTGERQRVALVRALVQSPRVLLLDEPTSGLDAASAARVEAALLGEAAKGCGLLVVSHDAGQLRRLGGRALYMNRQGALEPT